MEIDESHLNPSKLLLLSTSFVKKSPTIVKKILSFLFLSLLCLSTFASLSTDIQSLTKKYKITNASIGIAVQRTKSGQSLYQYHANKEFTPASNNKLFTATAALLTLPSNFTFNTSVYANPLKINNHTINDNLYIKFTGDPSLTSSQLSNLIQKLKRTGISKVNGNIILIANRFSGQPYPQGWSNADTDYCYAAPASSMNLNKNCMVISVNSTGNGKSTVKRLINTQSIQIVNALKLVSNKEARSCAFKPYMTDRNVLHLTGCIPNQAETRMSFAIINPALKTLNMVKDALQEKSIKLSGTVKIGNLPSGLSVIADTSSASLNYLLKHMLLHSDNLYAESLARSVGYKINGVGSTDSATSAISATLRKDLGLNTGPLVLKDGSGLSHLDKTSPEFLVNLLTKAYNDKQVGQKLYNALPRSGISGTLSYRMNKTLQGKVRAKTGTLDGTVTLSGYVMTKKIHRLSFSIMINNLNKSQRNSARAFQNQVVKLFYEKL